MDKGKRQEDCNKLNRCCSSSANKHTTTDTASVCPFISISTTNKRKECPLAPLHVSLVKNGSHYSYSVPNRNRFPSGSITTIWWLPLDDYCGMYTAEGLVKWRG